MLKTLNSVKAKTQETCWSAVAAPVNQTNAMLSQNPQTAWLLKTLSAAMLTADFGLTKANAPLIKSTWKRCAH